MTVFFVLPSVLLAVEIVSDTQHKNEVDPIINAKTSRDYWKARTRPVKEADYIRRDEKLVESVKENVNSKKQFKIRNAIKFTTRNACSERWKVFKQRCDRGRVLPSRSC